MNKDRDNMFYGGYNGMPMAGLPNQGMFQNEFSPFNDMNNRLNKIENQIKRLDQRLSRLENPYGNNPNNYNNEPDNSMYMM